MEKEETKSKNLDKNILIKITGATKTYGKGEGQVYALKGVDLEVKKGELLVILGNSGSGKSTLLNLIGGMERPTSGTILVNGIDVAKLNDKDLTLYRRNNVGYIFQSFNLLTDLTAGENVLLSAALSHNTKDVNKALEMVGLGKKYKKYPSQMSGGEQQRVSIARALVKDSDFLLCDEPTGSLDYQTGKQIVSILEKLSKEDGKTIIFVTHTQAIGAIANRVIRVKNGQIVEETINKNPTSVENIEW
ncbi:MAG: ABC transporter ATP-binding protein [Bacilli bacterium]